MRRRQDGGADQVGRAFVADGQDQGARQTFGDDEAGVEGGDDHVGLRRFEDGGAGGGVVRCIQFRFGSLGDDGVVDGAVEGGVVVYEGFQVQVGALADREGADLPDDGAGSGVVGEGVGAGLGDEGGVVGEGVADEGGRCRHQPLILHRHVIRQRIPHRRLRRSALCHVQVRTNKRNRHRFVQRQAVNCYPNCERADLAAADAAQRSSAGVCGIIRLRQIHGRIRRKHHG